MATGTIKNIVQYSCATQIPKNSSATFKIVEGCCMILCYRNATNVKFVDMLDIWSTSPTTVIGTRSSSITYTKTALMPEFTITNGMSTAIVVVLLGAVSST